MSQDIRLLVIGTSLRSRSIGGGESFLVDLVNAMAQRDEFQVGFVVTERVASRLRPVLSKEISLIEVANATGFVRVIRDFFLAQRWSQRWRADVAVYPHEWRPLGLRRSILVLQNVLWMHPVTSSSTRGRGFLLRLLTRATAGRADRRIAVSQSAAQLWSRLAALQLESIAVLPEGIDFCEREVIVSADPADVVVVTGDAEHKQHWEARRACVLVLRDRPILKVAIAGLAGKDTPGISYRGFLPRSELLGLMKASKVVIFPSLVESFGLPAFEATALGRECIVRSGTAMAEWLNGRVRTYDGTEGDLVRQTLSALDQPSHPEPIKDFLWASVTESWSALITEVASGNPQAK